MNLSKEQICSFAAGVTAMKPMVDGCRPHRFTHEMWALYAANVGLRSRAGCTAGVRLRFRSDTRRLRLSLRYGEPARWYFLGVTRIDDARSDAFGPVSRQLTWTGPVFEQAAREPHVFDLWLPHLCPVEVLAVEVEDGCQLEPAPPLGLRWLAFGDSITQGMNASLPVFTWAARCALALNADVINLGVGGATFHPELPGVVPPTRGDLITVAYGANDFNIDTPVATVREQAARLLAALQARHPAARLALVTPVPFFRRDPVNACGATLDDYRAALESAANAAAVPVWRGQDLVAADPVYFNDRSHPNDAGMLEIANNLLARVKALGLG